MAKLNVNVDNGLEELKLEKNSKKVNKPVEPKKKTKKSDKKKSSKTNFQKIMDELRLVTWPTKSNMLKYSLATIVMIIVLTLFFVGISALFDLLYGLVRGWIA